MFGSKGACGDVTFSEKPSGAFGQRFPGGAPHGADWQEAAWFLRCWVRNSEEALCLASLFCFGSGGKGWVRWKLR